ncbi:ABC transporter substrate-binding protein [Halanaerobacter jeridensis]|uniref:Peptide/nickel transport system substrate-binding protein/oligopeptide transport system substrate-binding protein n=1 Tax=Halanaerobacter jeridensis TaxID=706427 RepID=A0A939BS64_9FIRM|nr:ABC transporter substrate-binding protein [Halanaerobacter jeridensis]MBM7558039.1 peptide/nickel transport system substrate-binding protein/oligopeptide transport system substrate-binding protein [Halanaerobacter jeridensis]
MFKKLGISILILTLMVFFVVGCGGNQQSQPEKQEQGQKQAEKENYTTEDKMGGTFYGRLGANPPDLDPAHSTDTTSSRVVRNVFDGLVKYNEDLEVQPAIAKDWESSENGTEWIFHLREGVKFHNGREVKASDVVYSFSRLLDPETKSERAWLFENVVGAKAFQNGEADSVKGLKAVDEYTVKISLKEPFAPFLSMLCMENASIVPKEVIAEKGDGFGQHPVGAGPFEFKSWKQDSKLVLEKNEDYYEDNRPYLDKVVYRIIVEGTSAFPEYEQGNIYEFDADIPDGQMERVMDSEGEFANEYRQIDRLGTYYLAINNQKEPFNNKKVRKAMNYAVNKEVIAKVVRNGTVNPANGILPPGMPGYNSDLKGYPYNIEKAKELLKEAGYPDGLPGEYKIIYNTSKQHQRNLEAVQRNLKQIGINVKLVNMDWGTVLSKADKGSFTLMRMGWIADYPDPDNFLHVLFHSKNAGAGGNYAFYKNEDIDKKLEKARKMDRGEERLDLYQEIEKELINDAPWVPIYYYSTPVLVQSFVHDYVFTGQTPLPLTDVWVEPGHKTK